MNFIGSSNWVKFIAPFSEEKGSDLGKFGFYLEGEKVKMNFIRIDKEKDDFTFSEGFPGAQILGTSIEELKFSYFDGEKWKDEWNTEGKEELPSLVKVEISMVSPEKVEGKIEKKQFSKLVKLENK